MRKGRGQTSFNLADLAALDPVAAAEAAQLHHTLDDRPGITRRKARSGFDYRRPDGSLVSDVATLRRITSIVIPPAWVEVWINPNPQGHIQATGRDQRGRKQYRYHPRWRVVRDESKYNKLLAFAQALPLIRARVDADLRRHGLPRDRVLAAVIRLMELTLFRVGNSEYARSNKSFGLTTLRGRHVRIRGGHIHLSFRGKGGTHYETDINDLRVARIVKSCRELPGYELFQYLDEDGERHPASSTEVNTYLREITAEDLPA
jgi:DNA topoisomerase I